MSAAGTERGAISAAALARSYDSPVFTGTVPERLKALPQWMIWRPDRDGERVNKAPRRSSDGRKASKTDPANYSTFEEAVAGARRLAFPGIGICLTERDPVTALDLDHCVSEAGVIDPEALSLVKSVGSYAELSPSRRGIRLFCLGTLPRNVKNNEIEMYHRGAFLTVTGDAIHGRDLCEAQNALAALVGRYAPDDGANPGSPGRHGSRPYEGPPREKLDLQEFLSATGVMVLGTVSDTSAEQVFRVVCPWVHEHSYGDRSGTRCGQYPDGATFFHCEHGHCHSRKWPEFREEVDPRPPSKGGKVYARRRGVVRVG